MINKIKNMFRKKTREEKCMEAMQKIQQNLDKVIEHYKEFKAVPFTYAPKIPDMFNSDIVYLNYCTVKKTYDDIHRREISTRAQHKHATEKYIDLLHDSIPLEEKWFKVFIDGSPHGISAQCADERGNYGVVLKPWDDSLSYDRHTEPLTFDVNNLIEADFNFIL